jgi:hypothetical protein
MSGLQRNLLLGTLVLGTLFSCLVPADEAGDPEEESGTDVSYELKVESERKRRTSLGEETEDGGQDLGLEFSAGLLYPAATGFTLFAEVKALLESQRTDAERDRRTDEFLERGELWLRWQPTEERNVALKLGRQEFTEPRHWWWDEDLDAVRFDVDAEHWTVAAALAREAAPRSTLEDDIHPADEGVVRALGHLRWRWMPDQQVDVFALYQNDRSSTPEVGEAVRQDDAVDANLGWWGVRVSGHLDSDSRGSLNYWLDSAWVRGVERLLEFEDEDDGLVVVDRSRRDVRGWALDIGGIWTLPITGRPRLMLGYAFGSGDADPDSGGDRSFRQTGLQDDEDRIHAYGELLNPELSNLQVFMAGVGWPLSENTLLTLVHHRYRQVEAADFLREAGIDRDPEGIDKSLGWAWDLILQHEIEDGLSVEASGSVFEAGRAFGDGDGERAYRIYVELIYAF